MIIEYRDGDLLKQSDLNAIIHQTNCQGVMGSGLALSIKNKYPEAYYEYQSDLHLGHFTSVEINDDLRIYNLNTQYDFGGNVRNTNYFA